MTGPVAGRVRLRWLQSALHPATLSLDPAMWTTGPVDAAQLRDDIAGMSLPPVITGLRAVLPATQDMRAFAACGFRPVRRTRIVPVDVLAQAQALPSAPAGWRMAWRVPGEAADWPAWFEAHCRHYRDLDPTDPPRDPGPVGRPLVFGGDDLSEALWVDAGESRALRGFGSLRRGRAIGWLSATDAAPDAVPALLGAVLRRAAAQGWSRAQMQVDDGQAALWDLVRTWPGGSRFVTWHLPLDGAAGAGAAGGG